MSLARLITNTPSGAPWPNHYTICTSGTRPASPAIGDSIYETDTAKKLIYSGAVVGWTQPWNRPWGRVGIASTVTAQTGISTVADLTSLTNTATYVANRYYLITGIVQLIQITTAGAATLTITDSSNVVQNSWNHFLGINYSAHAVVNAIISPVAGSAAYKLRLATSAGTINTQTASDAMALLYIEDIGPNGLPS